MARLILTCTLVCAVIATAWAIDCYSGVSPLSVKNTCDDSTVTQCYSKQKNGTTIGKIQKCGPGSSDTQVEDGCRNYTEYSITFVECWCSTDLCNAGGVARISVLTGLAAVIAAAVLV